MTLSPNLRGALWILASAVGFTVMTTLIKFLGDDYPAALQTFYRQLAGVLVLLPLIARDWRGAFRTTRPGIVIFRSSAGVLALIMSFYAYQKLPLADANALSFTRTLWLVPLAGLVLREPIGPRRISAALVGFVGVLIMLQPGAGGVEAWLGWPQLCALGAAFLFALTITGMKVMTRDHTPFVLLVYAAVLGLVFAIPPALFVWRWPTWPDLGLLAAMGVIGTLTQGAYIKGMEAGEAAVMAPVDYTRLVFAVIVGFLLFQEVPRTATVVGAVIVVGSTLFISWREHQLAKQAAAEPT
ncbi:DMT family transporter [Caulobacter vibrioides]|uniref:DMT family transporter n=1 Tax=Caulobacter vibrioides TaxID=155892 RepID=UPI000BB46941|nr:DMT family transporter [Caulobacter vibrioides]ATC23110.1 EamA/RhaT family transporter [Caulobacter vibrioides]AZH11323.1 DMT family transporter [Caulobacter vibrioides]PLR13217.1 EamA/RhaT family transporter [Caulobacter vibrioides]